MREVTAMASSPRNHTRRRKIPTRRQYSMRSQISGDVQFNRIWVISGGGSRGIQAIDLIEKHLAAGFPMPDAILGTSAGGLIAKLISYLGVSEAREEFLRIKKRRDLFTGNFLWGIGKLGLWNPSRLEKRLEDISKKYSCSLPFYTCSYDISAHEIFYFGENWHNKYHASTACIPLLVEPIDNIFVDGGLVENTPLAWAIDSGASEIEVFMCSAPEKKTLRVPETKIEMGLRSLEAMRLHIAEGDEVDVEVRNEHRIMMDALRRVAPEELEKLEIYRQYKEVEVRIHVPTENLLGILEFGKMREAYEILKRRN